MKVNATRGAGSSVEIEVEGLDQVFRALRGVDKEAGKEINRFLKQGAQQVAKRASSLSVSGPSGLSGIASRGYKVRAGNKVGRKTRSSLYGWVVYNLSAGGGSDFSARPGAAAAMLEFAGSRSPGRTPQGRGLIRTLGAYTGGRYAWQAYDDERDNINKRLEFAMRSVERKLQVEVNR